MSGSIHPPVDAPGWLNRNVLLLALSAFFADGGYQAVTAVFPLLVIFAMKEPPYVYGLLLALAFGGGSLFAYLGGRLGDKYNRKAVPAQRFHFPQYSPQTNRRVFHFLLVAATLFGFSYYALGFPILSVAETQANAALGILTFGIYLGFSSAAGYLLGSSALRPIRALWTIGYAFAGLASLIIGMSYLFDSSLFMFYVGAAALGISTGAIETFEPVLTSHLVQSADLSGGMGLLSMSRALGLFLSNVIMGIIFTADHFDSYLYAFATAILAAGILAFTERWLRRQGEPFHAGDSTICKI